MPSRFFPFSITQPSVRAIFSFLIANYRVSVASFFPSGDSAECNCSFKWKEENVDTARGGAGPVPSRRPSHAPALERSHYLCPDPVSAPPTPQPPTSRLMSTDLAPSLLPGHGGGDHGGIRDAENGAERGFGANLARFDEKFRPALEEISPTRSALQSLRVHKRF